MSKIEIAEYTIRNKKIPKDFDNYVIVQISDLHNKSFGKDNCILLDKVNYINPDVIFIKIKNKDSYINVYGLTLPFSCYKYLFDKDKNIDLEDNFLGKNLGDINSNEYNILLAHSPFYFKEYEKWGADLVLAGHVHGGIIRLPYVGGLLSPNRHFFPEYDLGKYEINNSTMIVSKGLGGSKVLIRVNCKPEVVKITLKSE